MYEYTYGIHHDCDHPDCDQSLVVNNISQQEDASTDGWSLFGEYVGTFCPVHHPDYESTHFLALDRRPLCNHYLAFARCTAVLRHVTCLPCRTKLKEKLLNVYTC